MNPEKTNSNAEQANQASEGAAASEAAAASEGAAACSWQKPIAEDDLMGASDDESCLWEEALRLHLEQMRRDQMRRDQEPARNLGPLKERVIRVCEERGNEASLADVMGNQPPTHLGRNFLATLQLAQEGKITMEKPNHPDEPLNPEELRFKLNQ